MSGTPLYTVSKLLNQKNPTVIKRYAHLSTSYRKEIAEKNAAMAAGWLSRLEGLENVAQICLTPHQKTKQS